MKTLATKRNFVVASLMVVAFVLGVTIEHIYLTNKLTGDDRGKVSQSRQVREDGPGHDDGFKLINPLLECDVADGMIDAYKENFRDELQLVIDRSKSSGDAATVAVYFRDLNNGPTFGINQETEFIPASLLKLPVVMAYYKISEDDLGTLDKSVVFEKKINLGDGGVQLIAPSTQLVLGGEYTNHELIRRAIHYSDNQAVTLLINNMPGKSIRDLYAMLGVRDDVLNGPGGQLTVKEYAAFFRILFNASYLSRSNSEQTLQLLMETEFDHGLVAGVPATVRVAHKFGEGGDVDEHQIHDCGIVYYPNHPYLLCVMSSGGDILKLEGVIAQISKFVYDKIDSEYKPATPQN